MSQLSVKHVVALVIEEMDRGQKPILQCARSKFSIFKRYAEDSENARVGRRDLEAISLEFLNRGFDVIVESRRITVVKRAAVLVW